MWHLEINSMRSKIIYCRPVIIFETLRIASSGEQPHPLVALLCHYKTWTLDFSSYLKRVWFQNSTCRSFAGTVIVIVLWARCIGPWGQEGFTLFNAFRFVCCDAKTRSLLNKKSVEHKSQYSPPGAGASLSSGSGTPGVPSEAFPAALFALAAEWLTKGWISSWLLRVSLFNSGPVGDVSGSHKAEGYCSFEFWHASPLSFGWSRKKPDGS